MALHKRGGIYHYHFWVDGTRYCGSTKKTNLAAARRMEALLIAQAEEKGDIVLRKRSPLLRDFKTRFFEWVDGNAKLKQKTKDYYGNGWRLLEETDVVVRQKQNVCSSAEFHEAWCSIGFAEKWLVTQVNEHGMMLVIEPLAKYLEAEIFRPSLGIGVPARQLFAENLLT